MRGIKIKYLQKRLRGKDDSFWYDGDIAVLTYKGREVTLVAAGGIRIHNKNNELVWDNKPRGPEFPEFKHCEPRNDKDLARLEELGYHWENNNWFEVFYTYSIKNGVHNQDAIMGDVVFTYTEGIDLAKMYLQDDAFWKDIDNEQEPENEEDEENRD